MIPPPTQPPREQVNNNTKEHNQRGRSNRAAEKGEAETADLRRDRRNYTVTFMEKMPATGLINVLKRRERLKEWKLKRKPNLWGTPPGPFSRLNNFNPHNQLLTLHSKQYQPSATTLTQSTGNLRSQTIQGCLPHPQLKQLKKSCPHLRQAPHSSRKTKLTKMPSLQHYQPSA